MPETAATTSIRVRTLDELLAGSAATESFKEAVRALAAGAPQTAIRFERRSPPVKVLRAVMKLLEERPELPLESVSVDAVSGCSDFRGTLDASPGGRIPFAWDCKWRAETLGWNDAFGDPDQIRAAQTYGYQCFESFG